MKILTESLKCRLLYPEQFEVCTYLYFALCIFRNALMGRGPVVGYFYRNERFSIRVATSQSKLISVKLEVLVSRLQYIYLFTTFTFYDIHITNEQHVSRNLISVSCIHYTQNYNVFNFQSIVFSYKAEYASLN